MLDDVALPPQLGAWTSVNGAHALTVDADGNLLVATTLDDGASSPHFAMGVVRVTPSGSLDTAFGTGGLAVVGAADFGTGGAPLDAEAGAIAVLSDRGVIVAGATDAAAPGLRDLAVARLSAGTADNPPVVSPIVGPTSGKQGDTFVFQGWFTDDGDTAADAQAWTVTDSTGTVVATGAGATFTWAPEPAGTFTVTYTVTDGGGHAASTSKQVVVAPFVTAIVVDGVLTVKGIAGDDVLTLVRDAQGNYVLTSTTGPARTFAAAGLSGVRIDAGNGNDRVAIDPSVTLPVEIHGGAGDDSLIGGSGDDLLFGEDGTDVLLGGNGNDVVVGGAGTDTLFGGNGRDVLIGGTGADVIAGDNGDDVLIAGSTSHDADPAALAAIRTAWSSGADYATRVRNLSATLLKASDLLDDGSDDLLSGNNGKDWFVADRTDGDLVLDVVKQETVTDPA
jgi:Ca2+-binding RTX toxin-like protein